MYERDPDPELPPYIYTDLDVTVIDAYKIHPHAAGVGGTMTITHPGGRVERADAYYVSETNQFPPPAIGSEWILFLHWNEATNQYEIVSLQHGAFVVGEGGIVPVADSRFGAAWSGREVDALAAAIRDHSRRHR